MPHANPSDAEVEDGMNEKFEKKRKEVQKTVMDYLIWFETCPLLVQDPETRLPKMEWDSVKDDAEQKASDKAGQIPRELEVPCRDMAPETAWAT